VTVWNINVYSQGLTEASKSVLLEILRTLGSYRDHLVLSGGWTPYFILQRFGKADRHCGSIDIDFVLNPRLVDLRVYETIVSMIEKRGYKPYKTENGEVLPYRFYRSAKSRLISSQSHMLWKGFTHPCSSQSKETCKEGLTTKNSQAS